MPGAGFRLRIDPDPGLVATARLFAASVARQLGVAEGDVDDLKLAVTEGCAASLEAAPAGSVTLILDPGAGVLDVSMASSGLADVDARTDADPEDRIPPVAGFAMIRALFEDARVLHGAEPAITFTVPTS